MKPSAHVRHKRWIILKKYNNLMLSFSLLSFIDSNVHLYSECSKLFVKPLFGIATNRIFVA